VASIMWIGHIVSMQRIIEDARNRDDAADQEDVGYRGDPRYSYNVAQISMYLD